MKKFFTLFIFLIILSISSIIFLESNWFNEVSFVGNVRQEIKPNFNNYVHYKKNVIISHLLDKVGYDPTFNKNN